MQKTVSLHTSLSFIFGTLNLKCPQKINTVVTLSVLEGGKKNVSCVLEFFKSWMNNDSKIKKKKCGISTKYTRYVTK